MDQLQSVFKTDDPGVLTLAKMALDAEGIEYIVKNFGKTDTMDWTRSQQPTSRPIVVEVMVAPDVAARARDLLADLNNPAAISESPVSPAEQLGAAEPPAIWLEDAVAGTTLGTITESQLQEITSRLEEDSEHAYAITVEAVDMLQEAGVDPALIKLLRNAVGADGSDLVIRWVVR